MGKIYCKIDMEKVEKIISQKGFYFIGTKVLYPDFIGPKYIIVSDDPDITIKHTQTKGMIIVSTEKFKKMAEEYNRYFGNDDREKHRYSKYHNVEGYYEDIIEDEDGDKQLYPMDIETHPVEDEVENKETIIELYEAIDSLNPMQKERIVLYYIKGLTQLQIAELQGVRLFTVQKSIKAAEKNLKKILEMGGKNSSPIPL